MAEIEHFVDPEGGKKHPKFPEVENVELALLARDVQLAGKTDIKHATIGEADMLEVDCTVLTPHDVLKTSGHVDKFADWMCKDPKNGDILRADHFVEDVLEARLKGDKEARGQKKIGVDMSKVRFRQHMQNEMAHYATDCWDAELLTSSGWIECVGCADRSAYDLTVHAKKTGAPLIVRDRLDEPIVRELWEVEVDKKKFGPKFKKDGKIVEAALEATSQEQREALAKQLSEKGSLELEVAGVADGKVEISKDLVTIEFRKKVENTREYTPNVIEPSFGIGRILYSLIEHSYWTRGSDGGDEARSRLPMVADESSMRLEMPTLRSFCEIF
ncbi:Glycine--tRNA ligase 1 like protein [Verticillium longisporum]|nr:Glycine--tRNA ligase 1 like protein [Verticillium longisporum]